MGRSKKSVQEVEESTQRPPARTPKESERRLTNLAMKLAEKQLRDGSASSQVITHFLKLATAREELEAKRIEQEIYLAEAKRKQLQSYDEIKDQFAQAIDAMKMYGIGGNDE